MKLHLAALPWLIILSIFLSACGAGDHQPPDVTNIEVPLQITRWDHQLFQLSEKKEIRQFLDQNPVFAQQFFHSDQYPHDSLAVNYLHNFLSNPGSEILQKEIDEAFGDLKELQMQLTQAFKYLKHYYPNAKIPKVYTAVTGFAGGDLWVSDSVVVIGLDYYLGDSASFRPLEFPAYILKRYQPEYIVPSLVLLLSGNYNRTVFEDKTMLADMIYYGKAYYFTQQILPHTPDSLLIGYSGEDLNNVNNNQDLIWAHFVDEGLLYENSHFIKKKYMEERPKTLEIGNACPGRIGAWLGWEIVNTYMKENQEVTLPQLMGLQDAPLILTQSKYKPKTL